MEVGLVVSLILHQVHYLGLCLIEPVNRQEKIHAVYVDSVRSANVAHHLLNLFMFALSLFLEYVNFFLFGRLWP